MQLVTDGFRNNKIISRSISLGANKSVISPYYLPRRCAPLVEITLLFASSFNRAGNNFVIPQPIGD